MWEYMTRRETMPSISEEKLLYPLRHIKIVTKDRKKSLKRLFTVLGVF